MTQLDYLQLVGLFTLGESRARAARDESKIVRKLRAKRAAIAVLLGLALAWLATLGVHVVNCSSAAPSVSVALPGVAAGRGTINAYIGPSKPTSHGVPYLLHSTADHAPFPLVIFIVADRTTQISAVELTGVTIGADPDSNLMSNGRMLIDNGHQIESDDGAKVSFSATLCDAVSEEGPVEIRLVGSTITEDDLLVPFDVELNVPFERESHVFIGWVKLLHYDHY
ncbi:MAG: hypothetical protein AAGD07_15605 [Planctomycetota bacterium]